jgi:8-oxo-dGTP pyrophosphatase MutT (NUDIX family)
LAVKFRSFFKVTIFKSNGERTFFKGIEMIEPWKVLGEKVDYDCGYFKVLVRKSASPVTGVQHPFYILTTHSWVNIIALTPGRKVLLVSQFRHGSMDVSLEIPGGAVDRRDPQPLEAAKRELLEETGHEADEWHQIGATHPNPAILDNTCFLYLALGARKVADLKLDEAEELEVLEIGLDEIPRMIQSGKIRHALVIAAFYYLELFMKENPDKIEQA